MAKSHAPPVNKAPVRPAASPRSTPSSSRSSFDFQISLDEPEDERSMSSSGAESPVRGRTLHRVRAHSRLVSRATTRRHTDFYPPDFDGWRQRLLSHEFTQTPAEYDDSFLEPLPQDRFLSSLSEELHRAATFDSSIDIGKFAGHRDTFAVLGFRRLQLRHLKLPSVFFVQIAPKLDFDTYKAVRLSCYSWSVAITEARPIILPPVVMLAAEILEKIYLELSPVDFNAARRICRAWMITSLEERLLTLMLKRGGWSGAVFAEKGVEVGPDVGRRKSFFSDDWLLSKRLATECSLTPGWSGHGMSSAPKIMTTGLQLTCEVDFSSLGHGLPHPSDHQFRGMTGFEISACTTFLLAFKACTIYIYSLREVSGFNSMQPYGGHLELLTTLFCPDRVLGVSMDTSSQRYSVAALLHGSVGLVCDIDLNGSSARKQPLFTKSSRVRYDDVQGTVYIPPLSDGIVVRTHAVFKNAAFGEIHNGASDCEQDRQIAETTAPETGGAIEIPRSWSFGAGDDVSLLDQKACYSSSSNPHAENSLRTIYRNLCSVNDPPQSVAICPQRRCVAFGCRTGIELHWFDALTGQDLKRWFPLATPSDFLFFIPTRKGVDSVKKLRLISSSMHPDTIKDRTATAQTYESTEEKEDCRDLHKRMCSDRCLESDQSPEHHRAIPLSDGHHILFTLPGTGELCLGRACPQGHGARKWTRRFMFVGPKEGHGRTPGVYAAAVELRWGLRVAAAYGDKLWLFVVPPDLLFEKDIAGKQKTAAPIINMNNPILPPIRIEGTEFASIPNVRSLALDASDGDLTVWAVSSDAKASVFQLAGSGSKAVIQRAALGDGTLLLTRDADGDTIMSDAPDSPAHSGVRSDSATAGRDDCSLAAVVPCFPACCHAYCHRLLGATISPPSNSSSDDKSKNDVNASTAAGDAEVAMASGRFAIHVPPIWGRWSEEADAEWVPDYLRDRGHGIEDEGLGLDVLELCRCECDVIGP